MNTATGKRATRQDIADAAPTPGPWCDGKALTSDDLWSIFRGKPGGKLLGTAGDPYGSDVAVARANARVMAASWTMLALLREAAVSVAFLANTSTSGTNRVNSKKLLKRIEAAIAKATGAAS